MKIPFYPELNFLEEGSLMRREFYLNDAVDQVHDHSINFRSISEYQTDPFNIVTVRLVLLC